MTPQQSRFFRAVFGAVKNAADGHPDWPITETMARSIAKRAAGTLTASRPEVLAASPPSERPRRRAVPPRPACVFGATSAGGFGSTRAKGAPLRKAIKVVGRRSHLSRLHKDISALLRPAKSAGQAQRVEALIEVLRMIDRMRKEHA